jgi:cell division transport system permease protein
MRSWLTQHGRGCAAACMRLVGSPLASTLNVAVIGIALALPAGLYVVLGNLQDLARAHGGGPQVSVYMALDAGGSDVASVRDRLKQHARVERFRFVPRDQALRELKTSVGIADVVDTLQHNPLPDAFVIDAKEANPEALEALRGEFRKWPKVAHVQLDSAWARRLDALLTAGKFALLLLAASLAFGMVAVTFNTIRLQILTQREEIEISNLIGATDAFIRRPFLYHGAVLGAAGGLAAWALVWLGVHVLNQGLTELAQLYGANLRLQPPSLEDGGSLLLFSTWLSWFGAWLCVQQHLGRVEAA